MPVYKRDNSPYWYFDVMVQGKRKRQSTGRKNKREAEEVERQARREALDALQFGREVQDISVGEALFDHYLPTKQGKPNYRDFERRCEKVVGRFEGVKGVCPYDQPLSDLTASQMRSYRVRRKAQGAAEQTIDHEIKVLSAAYHLVSEDFRVRAGLKFPMARPKGKPRYLLPEEEAALLKELDPHRPISTRGGGEYLMDALARGFHQRQDNYDLVIILLDTGCRLGEITKLTWDMVDTVDWKWLHIWRSKVENEDKLAMTNRVREVLKRRFDARRNSYYVFTGWSGSKDVPRRSTAAIRHAMNKVGINHPAKVQRFGRRDVRSLRDTFATKLRMKGMSLDRLQKLLGHSSPQMTQKYANLTVDVASVEASDMLNQMEDA